MADIVAAVPRPGGREAFHGRLLDAVFRTLEVRRAFLAVRDPGGGALRTVASRNLDAPDPAEPVRVSGTVLARSLEEGLSQRLDDALADPDLSGSESVRRLGIRSVLCVPVPLRGSPEGVLYADNRARRASFSGEDMEFLETLGRLAGVVLENLEHAERLDRENERLRAALREGAEVIATGRAMEPALRDARRAAATDATVLLLGESGTGKELLATAIHRLSPRRDGPFVAVNCAAIPDALLEAELFGLAPRSGVAGAPAEGRQGRFERADGGTLFLDEIGDMGQATQARILRALETRSVERLGGTAPVRVDIRVVAATNRDLAADVAAGRFRQDLLFRLRVVEITIPPLRDRTEDILPLAESFLRRFGGQRPSFTEEARRALLAHPWPGNVRELRNAVERAVILCEGRRIGPEHFPVAAAAAGTAESPLRPIEEVEKEHIARVLRALDGNVLAAAKMPSGSPATPSTRASTATVWVPCESRIPILNSGVRTQPPDGKDVDA